MRIAIFSDNFYPEISGISDSIILLGKELTRRGHAVMFVAPHHSKKDYAMVKGQSGQSSEENIIRLPSVHYPGLSTGQARIALPVGTSLFRMRKFRPDVIHSQTPFGTGLEALLVSRLLGVPMVGTNHTPVTEFMPFLFKSSKTAMGLSARYFSWYYNWCLFVSAPCNALLVDMAKQGFRRDAIANKAISNPIDLDAFQSNAWKKESRETLKKRFGFSPHTVFYSGRLAEEKRCDVVIRAIAIAVKDIPDINFVMTGHGRAQKSLQELADSLGIEKNVKFVGFIDQNVLPLMYRASDIFAIMSTAETQSLSLMQAMAAGLPGIGARAWGLPEYIDDGTDGYILEPGDYKSLAKILVDLFRTPAHMCELGAQGMEAVKKYSPPLIAETWEKVYTTALQQKS